MSLQAVSPERVQSNPLDVVEEILAGNEWLHERASEEELAAEVEGRWCDYRLFFVWREETRALHFTCCFDARVPDNKRRDIHDLLAPINEKLGPGQFEVAGDDFGTPDGTCVRDFVHVADVARAHLRALEYLWAGGASRLLNIGAGQGTSVLQLVASVEHVTGKTVPLRIGRRRPGDVAQLVADVGQADATLGWRPELSLDAIVSSAARWHARR